MSEAPYVPGVPDQFFVSGNVAVTRLAEIFGIDHPLESIRLDFKCGAVARVHFVSAVTEDELDEVAELVATFELRPTDKSSS